VYISEYTKPGTTAHNQSDSPLLQLSDFFTIDYVCLLLNENPLDTALALRIKSHPVFRSPVTTPSAKTRCENTRASTKVAILTATFHHDFYIWWRG
ncbi:MAG: hypothetical protein ACREQ8_12335, partial [Woeseiaceae bacterium]